MEGLSLYVSIMLLMYSSNDCLLGVSMSPRVDGADPVEISTMLTYWSLRISDSSLSSLIKLSPSFKMMSLWALEFFSDRAGLTLFQNSLLVIIPLGQNFLKMFLFCLKS